MPTNSPIVEKLFDRNAAARAMGMELMESGVGHATVALTVADAHLNFNGTCHGGIVFSLADMAFGLASNSHGPVAAGINANIAYHAATQKGERLVARAREVTRSRRLASYSVDVEDEKNTTVASFNGTVFITSNSHDE